MIKPWLNMVKPQGLQLFWRLYGEIPSIALGPLGPCLQWSATRAIEGWEAASLARRLIALSFQYINLL